jgi:hypothetical protein
MFERFDFMYTRCKRAITKQESRDHFPHDQARRCEPWYQMAVIRMNSTYLECVDRMFAERGTLSLVGIVFLIIYGGGLCGLLTWDIISKWGGLLPDERQVEFFSLLFMWGISSPVLYMLYWFLRQEFFCYTHYPIRFNRKTRQVHLFRNDGTVMIEDWDKLYFTIMEQSFDRRRVAILVLDESRQAVLEYFSLPYITVEGDSSLYSFFEFVRRYMDGDGTQLRRLADQIDYAPNIVGRRESFIGGFHYMFTHDTGGYWHLQILSFPMTFLYSIARWLAMHTSKLPRWPEEIERECEFPPTDPYLRDAKHTVSPEMAQVPEATYTPRSRRNERK